ncbi:hypothetical protein L7F22_006869 [Adiantum nelumboides]|nr:hypothetical protein [Adiantum nelumboides]
MITMQEGKLHMLCLHGFHTSAAIFEKQIHRWETSILQLLDLNFLDGPYIASGKSKIEAIFPGPYFEWFQFNKDYSEFTNLEECKDFLSKYMQEHGPFDGLMGFSWDGVQAAAFAGLQQKGMVLQGHPPLCFIILVLGIGLNNKQAMHECYSEIVLCPSAHVIGDQDCLRLGVDLFGYLVDDFFEMEWLLRWLFIDLDLEVHQGDYRRYLISLIECLSDDEGEESLLGSEDSGQVSMSDSELEIDCIALDDEEEIDEGVLLGLPRGLYRMLLPRDQGIVLYRQAQPYGNL